jgi:predicted nucleic acid-binding protein
MVLLDNSVWIQHFRHMEPALADRLSEGLVLMHPFVASELACGALKNRGAILSYLHALPAAAPARDAEVLQLIEDPRLWGRGLGCVSAHLPASALLSHCEFWTLDKRQTADGVGRPNCRAPRNRPSGF